MTELLVQFNSVVGDVEGNQRLQAMLLDAEPFDLALVPELARLAIHRDLLGGRVPSGAWRTGRASACSRRR